MKIAGDDKHKNIKKFLGISNSYTGKIYYQSMFCHYQICHLPFQARREAHTKLSWPYMFEL